MIKLFALGSDGWALVRRYRERWLLIPPYSKRYRLSPREVARTLLEGGFDLIDREFKGWEELTTYLNRRRVEAASSEKLREAGTAAQRLMRYANAAQSARHLDRIAAEIDAGRLQDSMEALRALAHAHVVQNDEELGKRAAALMARAGGV